MLTDKKKEEKKWKSPIQCILFGPSLSNFISKCFIQKEERVKLLSLTMSDVVSDH